MKKTLQADSGLNIFVQSKMESVFNEPDVLHLIPTIIRKLKENALGDADQQLLKKIYGVLWQLITDEAARTSTDSVNPVLKELLRALELHLKRRQNRQYDNDLEHNTVQRIVRHRVQQQKLTNKNPMQMEKRLLKMKMREDVAPAQRLLKFAALLIHESIVHRQQKQLAKNVPMTTSKTPKRLRIHKKQLSYNAADGATQSIKSIMHRSDAANNNNHDDDHDVEEPILDMNLGSINVHADRRVRRHVKYDVENDAEEDDIDDNEIEMNLLRSLIGPEDDGESDETSDDETYNEKSKSRHESITVAQTKKQDYTDYAFDESDNDTDGEEELLLRAYYAPRTLSSSFDEDEYGSFTELMQLAAKHHMRAQRDSGYLKRLHVDDYLNDEEDY